MQRPFARDRRPFADPALEDGRRERDGAGVAIVAYSVLLAGLLVPVTFHAPHAARASAASLDAALSRSVDARIEGASLASTEAVLQFALAATARDLHFGLAHTTTLRFGTTDREANCIEYAHLFTAIFNRAAAKKQVAARAWVVHSEARVLGQKLPVRGLDDHDWVLIVPRDPTEKRRLVDPTFYDFGLGWDIASNVSGAVKTP